MPNMTVKTWGERLQRFPLHEITLATGRVTWRQAARPAGSARAITHVLLHGIGSNSANWLSQLEAASDNPAVRVVAWDAPGYGRSDALPMPTPAAADYAQRLLAWLDALATQDDEAHGEAHGLGSSETRPSDTSPITLVGHSLGCLMAASAARQVPERIRQLILLSPAQGYAQAPAAEREKKLQDRLDLLARLGPEGMAQLRGAAMLAPHADADHVALVQHIMRQIDPHGYSQAARMLAGGDLLADLFRFSQFGQFDSAVPPAGQVATSMSRVLVASGSADTITPPSGCQQVAAHIHAQYTSLGEVGHACAIEAADQVTGLIGLASPAMPAMQAATQAISMAGASHAT